MGVVTWTPICTAIGVLNLFVFAFQSGLDYFGYSSTLNGLAFRADDPAWYQYISSLFLHGDYVHLTSNAFALFAFGCPLEKSSGRGLFLLIYFISGIGGNLFFQMFNELPAHGIGASGAIFGIICSMVFVHPKAWVIVPSAPLPVPIALFALIYLATEFYRLGDGSNISHIAHIGGGLFGALVGIAMTKKKASLTGS